MRLRTRPPLLTYLLTNCSRSSARPMTQYGVLKEDERANKAIT